MTDHSIEATEHQRDRVESLKDRLEEADPDFPRPTDENIMGMLLDTEEAVQDGFYPESNDYRSWPVNIQTKLKRGTDTRDQDVANIKVRGETAEDAADKLEAVLERAGSGDWANRLRHYQPGGNPGVDDA